MPWQKKLKRERISLGSQLTSVIDEVHYLHLLNGEKVLSSSSIHGSLLSDCGYHVTMLREEFQDKQSETKLSSLLGRGKRVGLIRVP